jgi:peroxiredoxin
MSNKASDRSRNARRLVAEQAVGARKRKRLIRLAVWTVGLIAVAGVVATMMQNSKPTSSTEVRVAPAFALTDTTGNTVRLSDYKGKNVVLYFSEGAGCQACLVQMREIERDATAFKAAGVTVLPIVMNSREQITHDMAANEVTTPFLLDDGTVSRAYGVLGNGMHSGLPGHSFVLIDNTGHQRWYGEYPSMWMAPNDLLAQVESRLTAQAK